MNERSLDARILDAYSKVNALYKQPLIQGAAASTRKIYTINSEQAEFTFGDAVEAVRGVLTTTLRCHSALQLACMLRWPTRPMPSVDERARDPDELFFYPAWARVNLPQKNAERVDPTSKILAALFLDKKHRKWTMSRVAALKVAETLAPKLRTFCANVGLIIGQDYDPILQEISPPLVWELFKHIYGEHSTQVLTSQYSLPYVFMRDAWQAQGLKLPYFYLALLPAQSVCRADLVYIFGSMCHLLDKFHGATNIDLLHRYRLITNLTSAWAEYFLLQPMKHLLTFSVDGYLAALRNADPNILESNPKPVATLGKLFAKLRKIAINTDKDKDSAQKAFVLDVLTLHADAPRKNRYFSSAFDSDDDGVIDMNVLVPDFRRRVLAPVPLGNDDADESQGGRGLGLGLGIGSNSRSLGRDDDDDGDAMDIDEKNEQSQRQYQIFDDM